MTSRKAVPLLLVALLSVQACAGQVRVSRLQPDALDRVDGVKGVVFYQPMLVKFTHRFTTLVDDKGKVIGSAPGTCELTIQKEETSVLPDLSQPMVVRNASGWFSSAKFSVSLTNGLLTAVNAEPTQKASELLTALGTAATAFGTLGVPSGTKPACNASPVLSDPVRIRLPTP